MVKKNPLKKGDSIEDIFKRIKAQKRAEKKKAKAVRGVRTPEEVQDAQRQGQAYLREREKMAGERGLTSKQALQAMVDPERKKQRELEEKKAFEEEVLKERMKEEERLRGAEEMRAFGRETSEERYKKWLETQPKKEKGAFGRGAEMVFKGPFKENQVAIGYAPVLTPGAAALGLPSVAAIFGKIKLSLGSMSGFTKTIGAAIGIGGVGAIGTALTSGRVRELERNIGSLRTAARNTQMSVSSGLDPDQAIEQLLKIESDMIELEGKLHLALSTDIMARFRNKNLEEYMFDNLNAVKRRREKVQMYRIDGDIDALMREFGQEGFS